MRFSMLILLVLLILPSCSEKEFDPADPQKSFNIAKEPYDDENWERAVTRLGEFKSRFPYSQYAVEAELLIANAHFELEQFGEAAASYEQFVKLHPNHPKVDYAMFRVGESYWTDAPDDIDRDQEYTHKAIAEWDKLIQRFPKSSYTSKAKELVKEGNRRIAESEDFIASFYCKQEIYDACAYRYLLLVERYGQFKDLTLKAAKNASKALDEIAVQKEKDKESDKNLYFKNLTAAQIRAKADELKKYFKQES